MNELFLYTRTCMSVKIITLSIKSQMKKSMYYVIPFILNSRKCKPVFSLRKQRDQWFSGGERWKEKGITKAHKDNEYVRYLDGGVGFLNVHVCQNLPKHTL